MGVNLRGMTDYNVDIYYDGKVIGEIDPISARAALHKDAIYQHLGRRYISLNLDLEKTLRSRSCQCRLLYRSRLGNHDKYD